MPPMRVGIASAAVLSTLAMSSAQASAAGGAGLGILIPDPGHVSIEVASAVVKAEKPSQLPTNVRLGFPKAKKLPESVRILWATRSIRDGKHVTYAAIVVVVNQASAAQGAGRSVRGGGATPLQGSPGFGELIWDMFVEGGANSCSGGCGSFFPKDQLNSMFECSSCAKHHNYLTAVRHADVVAPKELKKGLIDLFSGEAVNNNGLVFQGPGKERKTLETGHYDDGHAFSWNLKTHQDDRRALGEITNAYLKAHEAGTPETLIPETETAVGGDLNGDGAIGKPVTGDGQFVRDCAGQGSGCPKLSAALSFSADWTAFSITVPSGYLVTSGSVFRDGVQVGACAVSSANSVYCDGGNGVTAGTLVVAKMSVYSEAGSAPLPDSAGATLFMEAPARHGPFAITGP